MVRLPGLSDLSELLREGENSGVEFKRDDVQPRDFAKELVPRSRTPCAGPP